MDESSPDGLNPLPPSILNSNLQIGIYGNPEEKLLSKLAPKLELEDPLKKAWVRSEDEVLTSAYNSVLQRLCL